MDKTKLDSKSGLPTSGLSASGLPMEGGKNYAPRLSASNIVDTEARERIKEKMALKFK
jgi:hypothetical protein